MNNPLVTVACITYNHEEYLSECLDGILNQRCSFPVEVIIHDDKSTDNTRDIIHEYKRLNPHLIVILQEDNQYSKGKKPLIDFILPVANGEYIAFCEGDDYWKDPYKLQKQVDLLESSPDYVASFTNATVINELNNSEKSFVSSKITAGEVSRNKIYEIGGSIYPTASLVFRNKSIDFSLVMRYSEIAGDELLIFLLSNEGKIYFHDEKSCVYRRWSQGVYSSMIKDKQQLLESKEREFVGYKRLQSEFDDDTKKLLEKRMSTTALWICRHTNNLRLISKYLPLLNAKQIYILMKHKVRQAIKR